jgi:succinate dehydrogenase/fumarate reductase flavoprotein subunit
MWDNVGIIRTKEGLQSSLESLNSMRGITLHSVQPSDRFLISMMMDTAEVTALAALLRGESRGSHYRTDSPKENKEWEKKIVLKLCEGKCEVRYASP